MDGNSSIADTTIKKGGTVPSDTGNAFTAKVVVQDNDSIALASDDYSVKVENGKNLKKKK